MKIGIDFDGVLVARDIIPRYGDFSLEKPVDNAKEALWWLLDNDNELYICTARLSKDWGRMKWWMEKWSLPKLDITNKKRLGTHIYLDDRGIRFTNWIDFCKLLG